jgi:hypothetical protein
VDYTLLAGTATPGKDYVAATGTLTFGPTPTTSVPVVVKGDNRDEQSETFFIKLSNPQGVTISDAKGKVTILDDDGPVLQVAPPTVVERGPGQHPKLRFTIALSKPGVEVIKVTVTSLGGSAQPGGEYTVPAQKTFTFQPGQTSKVYAITTSGDWSDEPNEDVSISLTNMVNVTGVPSVKGTIKDDDCNGADPGAGDADDLPDLVGDSGEPQVGTNTRAIECTGEQDWYRVRIVESKDAINDNTPLRARVRLQVGDQPAQGGGDLDMCVYRKTIVTADTLIGCSTSTGTTDEIVELRQNDNIVGDDSRTLWVRVLHKSGTKGPNTYLLSLAGNVEVGVSDNL